MSRKTDFSVAGVSLAVLIGLLWFSRVDTQLGQEESLVFKVLIALSAAGVGSIIPGILNVRWNKTIRASGAIGLFVIIYFFPLNSTAPSKLSPLTVGISVITRDPSLASVKGISQDRLTFLQSSPIQFFPRTVARQPDGTYILCEHMAVPSDKVEYSATISRAIESSFQEDPSILPKTALCFKTQNRQDDFPIFFRWDEKTRKITIDQSNKFDLIDLCENFLGVVSQFISIQALANPQSQQGWIVPSLETLAERNRDSGHSYTRFKVESSSLDGLEKADAYSYALSVNNKPLYIDGWTVNEMRRRLDRGKGITVEFGLENLDFYGANYGKEEVSATFYFYEGQKLLKSMTANCPYVALRPVADWQSRVDGNLFQWSGDYILGKNEDGFEVFIWSSTDREEIATRKKRFDSQRNGLTQKNTVSVIRPPLGNNRSYGLVIGFLDDVGRTKFTFSRKEAKDILSWVKRDLVRRHIAHPQSHIFSLKGG